MRACAESEILKKNPNTNRSGAPILPPSPDLFWFRVLICSRRVSLSVHAFTSSHGHTVGLQAGIKIAQSDATGRSSSLLPLHPSPYTHAYARARALSPLLV